MHGFTASPLEVRWLGERLHAEGYTLHGVRLAGHGTSVDDLARTSWHDWLASARQGLSRLRRHTDTAVVAGLSMGSLLAIVLAHEQPCDVHGLAVLSTALWLHERRLERYLPLLRTLARVIPRRWQQIPKGGRDIADPIARQACPAYDTMPLRSVVNLVELQQHARPLVATIRQPVLAIHARQDHSCPSENVTFLQQHLPTPPQVIMLERSFHVITVDYEKQQVAERVSEFVAHVARHKPHAT